MPARFCLVRPEVVALMPNDWSGGFDSIFEYLSFPILYTMHAAIASRKLVLSHVDEAKFINAALEQCTTVDHALKALNDLFRGPQRSNCVNKLLKALSRRPDAEQYNIVGANADVNALPGTTESLCVTRRFLVTPLCVWPQLQKWTSQIESYENSLASMTDSCALHLWMKMASRSSTPKATAFLTGAFACY